MSRFVCVARETVADKRLSLSFHRGLIVNRIGIALVEHITRHERLVRKGGVTLESHRVGGAP